MQRDIGGFVTGANFIVDGFFRVERFGIKTCGRHDIISGRFISLGDAGIYSPVVGQQIACGELSEHPVVIAFTLVVKWVSQHAAVILRAGFIMRETHTAADVKTFG